LRAYKEANGAGENKEIGVASEFGRPVPSKKEKPDMLSWSITFLIIGIIAGVLGLSGIAGAAAQIAWILFVVFLVLFVVTLIMGRRRPV